MYIYNYVAVYYNKLLITWKKKILLRYMQINTVRVTNIKDVKKKKKYHNRKNYLLIQIF